VTDFLIRGGTVVRPTGSARADVLVRDETIEQIGPDLRTVEDAEIVDASGTLVLPGVVDVHTHTRLPSDTEPDRFFQDSVAAAIGGTTTFLSFNTPSSGTSPAAQRSMLAGLREWRAATASESAVDIGLSLVVSGTMDDPIRELAAIVEQGVPSAKAFMVYDFRLDAERLFEAMSTLGAAGGLLEVHCEDPVLIDRAVASALQRGNTAPGYHAATRSREAEAVATHRAVAFAEATGMPTHVVHLSNAAALREVREARARGVRATAETCPQYLVLDESVYQAPDDEAVARYVISPPIRGTQDREALWQALRDGDLELVATDHVPDRLDREKAEVKKGVPFDRISNGAPGIETLLTLLYSEGVAKGRITTERMVELLATAPARRFGLAGKGDLERGFDADIVLFDPAATRTIRAADLHHTSDYTPYEGFRVPGAIRDVFVRGRRVVQGGRFVGERGWGRLAERIPIAG